jgi:imidazolonepropionase
MSELGMIADAGILLEFDSKMVPTIAAVGKSDDIRKRLKFLDRTVDVGGRLVTPGFVDSHTHLCFAGNRADEWQMRARGATYEEIAAGGGGIMSTVRATREASKEELTAQVKKHIGWMSAETVTFEVKSGYGLSLESELKMLRAAKLALGDTPHVLTFLGAHAVPPEAGSRYDYLHEVLDGMLPAVAPLVQFVDMFVEDGYFTPADAQLLAATALNYGLKVRLHVDQLQDGGGAELAAEVGAVSADHLEHASERGMRAMAQAGVFAGLLPGSVFGLRKDRYPEGRKMIDLDVPVCLATDFNPGSSPVASLPFCMRLAVDYMGMTPAEALTAVTINPAHSLGLQDRVGSIEVGKLGALVVYEIERYEEIPYWIGGSRVSPPAA